MNFYLNDSAAEFELDNRELKFYPSDGKIEFVLDATQDRIQGEGWVLSTGIWNDNEFWDDNGIWNDGN
jgi:hypothetical protein